jgi:tetratricopeptide (TPR) repeat protein
MKKWLFSLVLATISICAIAQSADEVIKNSREFSMKGDIENSILTLKNGLEKYPENAEIRQELAMAYYSTKRNSQAMQTLEPLLNGSNAEETVFQVAGLIYRSELKNKDAEKVYKAGLKLYPKSGLLHNEYGQLMESMEPGKGEGMKLWEKGIEVDPGFAANYYQASRYYALANNTIWTILYGEIFVNLDSYSNRTIEIKNILFQFYKKLFAFGVGGLNEKNGFEKAVAEMLVKQKNVASAGINPESLSAIRTRFILDWHHSPNAEKYPFRLFERHQQMLRDGMFDAYNQWLFGGAANIASFQNWTKSHAEEYQAFTKFQRQKLFVLNPGQYYK